MYYCVISYNNLPLQEPSLYTVKAVLILDNDGDRLYAKVLLRVSLMIIIV